MNKPTLVVTARLKSGVEVRAGMTGSATVTIAGKSIGVAGMWQQQPNRLLVFQFARSVFGFTQALPGNVDAFTADPGRRL